MNNSRCLRVISPNGGEIYKEGEKITVRWESNVFSYPVVIQILKLPKGTPGVPNKNSIETSLMPPSFFLVNTQAHQMMALRKLPYQIMSQIIFLQGNKNIMCQ
jgi:hypothetical protein